MSLHNKEWVNLQTKKEIYQQIKDHQTVQDVYDLNQRSKVAKLGLNGTYSYKHVNKGKSG